MSHYRPYPSYKDSGVEWIGELPKHWNTLRIKRASVLRNERSTDVSEGLTYIGLEDVESESGHYAPATSSSRQSDDSMVGVFRCGDVLYGKLRPYLRKAIVADRDGVCSTEFLVLQPRQASSSWLHRWLLTPGVTQQVEAGCEGAKMPRADWEHVGSIHMPVPPGLEQTAIAVALDRETTRIDALIAKKSEFIELLAKKRRALIAHAVTKGLDRTAKLRISGVDWIGEVPEHWAVVPSNWLFSECKDRAFPDDQHLSATQKYGVIPLDEFERLEGRQVTHAVKNVDQRKHVEVGDFVISMRSFEGGIERVKARGCVRSSYVVLHAQHQAHVGFFSYLFKSSSYIQGLQATATFIRDGQDLSYANFRQVKLPAPPIDEQRQIAEFLDRTVPRLDTLITKTQQSIDLLKQRRSALITAAVTGQIDLRESA